MAWGRDKVRELRGGRREARNLVDGGKIERIVAKRYHRRFLLGQ